MVREKLVWDSLAFTHPPKSISEQFHSLARPTKNQIPSASEKTKYVSRQSIWNAVNLGFIPVSVIACQFIVAINSNSPRFWFSRVIPPHLQSYAAPFIISLYPNHLCSLRRS